MCPYQILSLMFRVEGQGNDHLMVFALLEIGVKQIGKGWMQNRPLSNCDIASMETWAAVMRGSSYYVDRASQDKKS